MRPDDLPPVSPRMIDALEDLEHPELEDFDDPDDIEDRYLREEGVEAFEAEMSAEDFIKRMGLEGSFLSGYLVPPPAFPNIRGNFVNRHRGYFIEAQKEVHRKKRIFLLRHRSLVPQSKSEVAECKVRSLSLLIYHSTVWKEFCKLYCKALLSRTTFELSDVLEGHRYAPRRRFERTNLLTSAWPNPNDQPIKTTRLVGGILYCSM